MNTMLINRNRIAAVFSFSGNGASVRSYNNSELNNNHTRPILAEAY